MGIKVISKNKRAFHEYNVTDSYEAGIELTGTEVKALRDGRVNLGDGWIEITDDQQAFLRDAHIGHYSHGNIMNHDEKRRRRLLLHRSELFKLARAVNEKGFSVVPIKIYFKGHYIKLEIALGKGKKNYDKRDSAKEKDANREIARTMRARG